ncbi:hypothetical protein C8T65DRAFT_649815 [Cerioporus squamosus]|nr:hypothetical protein C8T65DRAFT_649815 [Cerioporus squamosus]
MVAPSAISDAEQALAQNLDKRITETSTMINASRPVNRLPTELLITIFRYVHGSPPKNQYSAVFVGYRQRHLPWYPMIAVCRHWHSIVCATPMLWWLVRVLPETRMEHVELVLSRSKELPIEVDIYFPHNVAPYMEVLLRHRPRLASFHVQDLRRSQASHVDKFIQHPMPGLHTLNMWLNPVLDPMDDDDDDEDETPAVVEEEEEFMLQLSLDSYPELRELSLRGVGLQGPLPRGPYGLSPPRLTHIELRDSISPHCNIVEFVRFLGDCHHLQTITLVRFRPFEEDFDTLVDLDTLDPLPVVALAPTLRRLVVEDIDKYVARLLSGLTVPASTDVRLTKLINMRDGDELRFVSDLVKEGFLTVLPEDKSGLPLFNRLTSVYLCLSVHVAYLLAHAGERTMALAIEADPESVSTVLPNFTDDMEELAAANDSITELTLMNDGDLKIWSSDLRRMLSCLPKLKTLSAFSVLPPSYEARPSLEINLVEAIGEPDISDACAALEELNFNCVKPSNDEAVIANMEALLLRRNSQGMRLRHLRIELAGRGHTVNLSDEERTAREARYLESLRPLVDVVECAHDKLVD